MTETLQPSNAGTHPMNQEVQNIAKEALDTIIGNNAYQHLTTNQWSQQAVETITTNLVKLNKPYKYIVTCVIMQTNAGAGLSVSSTCYWDKTTDRMFYLVVLKLSLPYNYSAVPHDLQ